METGGETGARTLGTLGVGIRRKTDIQMSYRK